MWNSLSVQRYKSKEQFDNENASISYRNSNKSGLFPAIGPGHFNSSKHEFPSVQWGIKSKQKAGGYSLNLCATIGDYCGSLVYMHKFV